MLRIQNIAQARQQRTLRALYAQTQAYPYSTTLSSTVWAAAGTAGAAFSAGAGTAPGVAGQGPIFPGQVACLTTSKDAAAVSVGGTVLPVFGLFANFVGGVFDEIGDSLEIGIWRGQGSVWEVLTPAFNANVTSADEASIADRLLYPDADGKLNDSAVGSGAACAQLLEAASVSKLVIELLV